MSQKHDNRSFVGKLVSFILSSALIVSAFLTIIYQQQIRDYAATFNYTPTAEIAEIAEKTGLRDEAKRIFYATHPSIDGAEEFNQNCTNQLEQTTVLGCYKDDRIYIFDVKNPDLNGIKEATAVHELLHAVWVRLSEAERSDLSDKLNQEYERIKTPELEKTMENYRITEPGQHENELHSILPTEFEQLSPELEKYYERYFVDRQRVVAFYNNYNTKFTELKAQSDKIMQEAEALKVEIENESKAYQDDLAALNARISTFNSWARNGHYTSETEFYADREEIQAEVGDMNLRHSQINDKIEYFNQLSEELNQISIESKQLTDSIDSRLVAPSDL